MTFPQSGRCRASLLAGSERSLSLPELAAVSDMLRWTPLGTARPGLTRVRFACAFRKHSALGATSGGVHGLHDTDDDPSGVSNWTPDEGMGIPPPPQLDVTALVAAAAAPPRLFAQHSQEANT